METAEARARWGFGRHRRSRRGPLDRASLRVRPSPQKARLARRRPHWNLSRWRV